MSKGFQDGYYYYLQNSSEMIGAFQGGDFGLSRAKYIDSVKYEIDALEKSINAYYGIHTPVEQLKGNIAEDWQAGTYNVDAAINESSNRVVVNRSTDFGSVDISSNFGKDFGLKYYATAEDSAKQQAISVFQRFREYQNKGGKEDLKQFLANRHYTDEDILNDPVYSGQIRIIPKDQFEEAAAWLKRKIATESMRRPEQVKRYQDTLSLLQDRISDNDGNSSVPLSKGDAEKLAVLAKEGKFNPEEFDISTPDLLNLEMLVKESMKAGISAAIISLVLRIGPGIYQSVDYLIKNGEIDEDNFKKVGFDALSGTSEGFIRGSVAAAITALCKSGAINEGMRDISPGIIGTIVAVTMNTMKNAYLVSIGKKTRTELSNDLIRDMIIASSSFALGTLASITIFAELPLIGYLIGSFVGSVIGSFIYNTGYKAALSFCTETGVTLFGLVNQDYQLPEDIIIEMGLEKFEFDSFKIETFEPETFKLETFEPNHIKPDTLGISMLRRGVIGISKIGYV